MNLRFGSKLYSWKFIMADVTVTLRGADFLKSSNMMVGIARHQLVPSEPDSSHHPNSSSSKELDGPRDLSTRDLSTSGFPQNISRCPPAPQSITSNTTLSPRARPIKSTHDSDFWARTNWHMPNNYSTTWTLPESLQPMVIPLPHGAKSRWYMQPSGDYRQLNIKMVPDR